MTDQQLTAALRRSRSFWNVIASVVILGAAVYVSPSDVRHVTLLTVGIAAAIMLGGAWTRSGGVRTTTARRRRPEPEFVAPAALPPAGLLVGREADAERAQAYIASARDHGRALVVITGPSGIGKTALAVYIAHSVGGAFPGGTLFAELATGPSDRDVLASLVMALQPAGSEIPSDVNDLRRTYASLTAERNVLVVLDGAPNSEAVRPLLPAGADCAVIVTSRRPVADIGVHLPIALSKLDDTASLDVLEQIVGADRVRESEESADAAIRIARLTAGHPLALQVTASSLACRPDFPLPAAAARLRPGSAASGDFARALDLSYALLPDLEESAVRLLGLLPSQAFAPWMLAALLDEPDDVAWKICERLTHARLLERVTNDSSGVATFVVLDHVWDVTRDHPPVEEVEARQCLARLDAAAEARSHQRPRDILRDAVYEALDRGELGPALSRARGALAQANELGPASTQETGLALAAIAEVLVEAGGFDDVNDLVGLALRTRGDAARPRALRCLGKLQRRQRRLTIAYETMRSALDSARAIGDGPEEVRVLRELAVVCASMGRIDEGLTCVQKAWDRDIADERVRAALLPSVGWAKGILLAQEGDPDGVSAADDTLREAAALAERAEPPQSLWLGWIIYERARAALRLRRRPQARMLALEASSRFATMRHRYATARCRLLIGQSYLDDGIPGKALPFLEESLQTFGTCGDRWSEAVTAKAFARALELVDRPAEAATALHRAIAIFAALGDTTSQQNAAQTLGDLGPQPHRLASESLITVPSQVLVPTGDQDER